MLKLFWMLRQFSQQKGRPIDDDEPYIFRSYGQVNTVLIVVIGIDNKLVPEIIETIKKKFAKSDKLVFLTDDSDFTPFREQAVAFEYMPSLIEQRVHVADMPWQSYLRERWGLLLAKWKPRLILSYGTNIDAFLAAAPDGIPMRT